MATPRDLQRLALLALYQLDATGGQDLDSVRAALEDIASLTEEGLSFVDSRVGFVSAERDRAFALALAAWDARDAADAELRELAPEWPPSRMAAVDRAILRLAHHCVSTAVIPPKAAVNEAVELAKAFSTERSPQFINGVLGRVLKRVLAEQAATPEPVPPADSPAPEQADA